MPKFCRCGSLLINGSCTNRKCSANIQSRNMASQKQIDYIKSLLEQLSEDLTIDDYRNIDYKKLTSNEASRILDELTKLI